MMRLAKICCLLLISGPGCLVQSIILNQIKIPLHPQVTLIDYNLFSMFFQKRNVKPFRGICHCQVIIGLIRWIKELWSQKIERDFVHIWAIWTIQCSKREFSFSSLFEKMHVLSSNFMIYISKSKHPLDVLWSKPGKIISQEYQNMISLLG